MGNCTTSMISLPSLHGKHSNASFSSPAGAFSSPHGLANPFAETWRCMSHAAVMSSWHLLRQRPGPAFPRSRIASQNFP